MNKRTATPAAAGAALPATTEPTAPATDWPRDEYTGIGGDYVRDPITGVRTRAATPNPPVQPAAPAAGDTAAA